jgi:hypothetical protein
MFGWSRKGLCWDLCNKVNIIFKEMLDIGSKKLKLFSKKHNLYSEKINK